MRGMGLTRPDRADLAGGAGTDGDDQIHPRRPGTGEFIPALGARKPMRKAARPQRRQRRRVWPAGRL